MSVRLVVAPLLGVCLSLLAAWCTTGSRSRRAFGVVVGVSAMLPPWLLPAELVLLRACCALIAFTNVMRVADLVRMQAPLLRRVSHVISVIDSRRLVRAPPRFEWVALAQLAGWGGLVALGLYGVVLSSREVGLLHWLVRWAGGVVAVYAVVSGMYRLLFLGYRALGFDPPTLHDMPIRSRSVQELWGERWARPISDWLGETFFRPFARRRRPLLGVLLAFSVSAAFHAYGVWVGLGFRTGATMAALTLVYFVAQAAVMALERVLGVRSWPKTRGHIWTVAWMLSLAPLFVEPLVRVAGFP